MRRHDVIVVGSGAAGGVLCRVLTEAGLDVLLLEAGRDPSRDVPPVTAPAAAASSSKLDTVLGLARSELGAVLGAALGAPSAERMAFAAVDSGRRSTFRPDRQAVQATCRGYGPGSASLFIDDVDHPYTTIAAQPYTWIRGRQLGGRTQIWKRVTPRLTDAELGAPAVDGHGERWPITAAELEPHYQRVERMMRVVGAIEAGAAPYDGALPQRSMTALETRIQRAVEGGSPWKVRLAPYATPLGPEDDPATLTQRIELPNGGRDPTHDVSVRHALAFALRTGRLTVRTHAIVHRVVLDGDGRARGVAFIDGLTRREEEAEARVVVLAASTLETTRILLLSKLPDPSGALGSYLTDHLFGVGVIAHRPDRYRAQGFPDLFMPAWMNGPRDREKRSFIRNYQILGEVRALRGGPLRRWQTALVLAGQGEVLPVRENRVSLDERVRDAWGIPALRIEYARTENEVAMAADILATTEALAKLAGFDIVSRSPSPLLPGASVHELGTARMGASPETSVVSPKLCCWSTPNLYVADGAVFPSAAAQNPTLTIMALASKAADHIIETLRSDQRV